MNKITPIQNHTGTNSVINNTTAKSSSFQTTLAKETKSPASLNTYFEQAAKKYQIPVELLKAMGKAESDFNPNAVSSCGAQGVMQLMPATAKSLGVTNAFDPEQNIMGGAKYIASLLDRYDGNVKLAVAAYNAGSGNVRKYGGIPPFKETQNYVKKVCAYMKDSIVVPNTALAGSNSSASSASSSPKSAYGLYGTGEPAEETQILTIEDQLEQFTYSDYLLFIKLSSLLLGGTDSDNNSSRTEWNITIDTRRQEAADMPDTSEQQEAAADLKLAAKQDSTWTEYPGISPSWKTYLALHSSDTNQTI